MPTDHEPIRAEELSALFAPLAGDILAPCLLAVSGGSDSTALMVLFADWLQAGDLHPGAHTVVTVDHGLRQESAAEAHAVAAQAAALGFRHVTLVWKGEKPRHGVQAAARRARYGLIADYMRSRALGLLLTAHTRDDVAETLLMRLARGSGVDGLAAMAPRVRLSELGLGEPGSQVPVGGPDLEVVRPLLDVPKRRLRATLETRGIAWAEDPSNLSLAFERPRLRAARVGLDALGLGDAMLALSARRLLRARRALEAAADAFLAPAFGAVAADPSGYFVIDPARLQAAEAEIALRVLARCIAAAGGSREQVPLGKLEAIAEELLGRTPGQAAWTLARALITRVDDAVTIEREPGREPLPRIALAPGEQALWDGRFRVSVAPRSDVGALEVRALGEAALADLRRKGGLATRVRARTAAMTPAFWRDGALLAAPALGFWASEQLRHSLRSTFIGTGDDAPVDP
jgi:tRNA(Ile)-lysidine synthase